MYEIAMIGAGPAGSTLARLVADRYRVLLVDKRQLDGKALNQSLAGFHSRYAGNTLSMRLNIVLKNLKSPLMYNHLLRRIILQSGINSVRLVGPHE